MPDPILTGFQKRVLEIIQSHLIDGIEELDLRDAVYPESWGNHKGNGWRTAHIKRACNALEENKLIESKYTSRYWKRDEVELIIIWHSSGTKIYR